MPREQKYTAEELTALLLQSTAKYVETMAKLDLWYDEAVQEVKKKFCERVEAIKNYAVQNSETPLN